MAYYLKGLKNNIECSRIIEFIQANKIVFKKRTIGRQIVEIWFELFNEKLSIRQANYKMSCLRKYEFEFHIEDDYNTVLMEYISSNKIMFKHGNSKYIMKKIWFELFNEELSLTEAINKLKNLKRLGFEFHFENNSYAILAEYLKSNKIMFKYGNSRNLMKEIWFELFNEELSLTQASQKMYQFKQYGFKFNFENDLYTVLAEYLNSNNIMFKYGNSKYIMKKTWFELFNEELSLVQANQKIRILKKRGFEFNFKNDSYTVLIEYLNNNKIVFKHGKSKHQMKKIWFEIFNEELTLRQASNKFVNLRKRGFEFNIKNYSYTILTEYLVKNKITFKHSNSRKIMKKIWFELFNEELTLPQASSKFVNLKKRGFEFNYESNFHRIIEHLNNSNTWIEESEKGYIYLQSIWENFYKEKISFKKCELIFKEISLFSPQCVYMKIMPNFVSYKDIDKLSDIEYNEHTIIFAEYCRNQNIILSDNMPEDKLSRIWSVCFASKK
ncbi:MAG: hypothetical protein ACI9RG_000516 [Sulfurimonas sp.]|jgi:hypothetical protein